MNMRSIFDFLDELAVNNNRAWFAENRDRYNKARAYWLERLQTVISLMAAGEPALRYVQAEDCAYRIYRDIRFSNDKSPFKTYFSALISPTGRHCDRSCWYLHIGAQECAIYGGVWCPPGPMLRKLRKAIVDNIEEFRSITESPEMLRDFPGWWGRTLKTAPQGYPKDHPDIDLLRLTEYGKCHSFVRKFFDTPDWPEVVAQLALELKPMNDFLNYSIDE